MSTTTTETKKTAADLNEKIAKPIKDLAERIKESLELDATSGLVAEKEPGSVYKDAIKDQGLTMEVVDQVKKAEATIVSASTLAIGQIGLEAFKANPELTTVQGTIQMHDEEKFTAGIHRETQSRNPKTGEALTIHGQTFTQYNQVMTANKGGQGAVRNYLKAAATEAMSKGN